MIPDGSSAQDIHAHIKMIEEKGIRDAFELISRNLEVVKNVAGALQERQMLTGDEVRQIMRYRPKICVTLLIKTSVVTSPPAITQ